MRTAEPTNIEFESIDPRSGRPLRSYVNASAADVENAVRAASAAAADPTFADSDRRAEFLTLAAKRLRDRSEQIVALAGEETGLPEARLNGELERTASQLEAFAALIRAGHYVDAYIDPPDPEAKPIPRPDVRRMLIPIGPVAVFGASNFPLAFSVAGGDTASALAAGCPVVVKGHPAHPGTGDAVGRVMAEAASAAGMPEGSFAVLTSAGAAVGELLVTLPEIRAVAFTGSFAAGTALWRLAASRPVPIPVFAEMSSVNPLVVTPGAIASRSQEIAAGLTAAISGSAGQLCTKPGLIFVPADEAGASLQDQVRRALAELDPQVLLTEGVRDALAARVEVLERLSRPVGSTRTSGNGTGFTAAPRVFSTDATSLQSTPELEEENFGPVALFVEYRDLDELNETLAGLGGQLTGTIHIEPEELAGVRPILSTLEGIAGRLIFNGYPTGVSVSHAMQHGGPFPATTDASHSSVGMTAIARFLRPLAWQNAPADALPAQLLDENPKEIWRRIDGELQR